jgi:uncharacterized membrane protein
MSLPTVEPLLPDDHNPLPPARRRRKQRTIVPAGENERTSLLADLSARVVPSFDFFLFSLLSGIVLGAALWVDSAALVFLSALLAPFMAPVIAASLGTITGAARYWLQALASLLIGSLIIFLFGMLSGWAAAFQPGNPYLQAAALSQFTWAGLIVLALGTGFTTYLIVRSPQQKPLVTSIAIAYSLYLPIGAAGFGAGSGMTQLLQSGLGLFAIHLIWAILVSAVVLVSLGLRPIHSTGYLLAGAYLLAGIGALVLLQMPGYSPVVSVAAAESSPTAPAASDTPAATPVIPTNTVQASPVPLTSTPSATTEPPTPTSTPTRTLVPSRTPTLTLSPAPTPVWALVRVKESNGIVVRTEPGFTAGVVRSLLNDTLVELLPEEVITGRSVWVKIRTVQGEIGWVISSLLATATPAPNR